MASIAGDQLDKLSRDAYEELARQYHVRGDHEIGGILDEADPGTDEDQWVAALGATFGKIRPRMELHSLAKLLFPTDAVQSLIQLKPEMMTIEELTDELASWLETNKAVLFDQNLFGKRAQMKEALSSALALWIDPTLVIHTDWESNLQWLLNERGLSRVTRYLSIRHRQSSLGGS